MDEKNQILIDLNLSAEVARAADSIVAKGGPQDLSATASHLCGALGLVLFSLSKPGRALECIPGIKKALHDIIFRLEQMEASKIHDH